MGIFEELLIKSGLDKLDLENKIKEFKAKKKDFNDEIASFFVAKELGIELDDSKIVITPLDLIDANTKNANILITIEKIYPEKEFNTNGKVGKLQNAIITDNTKTLSLTLWNPIVKYNVGDVLLITNVFPNIFKDDLKLNTSKLSVIKLKGNLDLSPKKELIEKYLGDVEDKEYNLIVQGILKQKFDFKEISKDDKDLKIQRFILEDEGFEMNCVAWNNSAETIKNINENVKIKIENCSSKYNRGRIEININDNSNVIILDENPQTFIPQLKNISDLAYKKVVELNVKINNTNIFVNNICKKCNSQMTNYDGNYFCPVCNENTENYIKVKGILKIEDGTGNTTAIINKNNLLKLMNTDEIDLENKIKNYKFENLGIKIVGYLRKNFNSEDEFYILNML